MIDARGIFTSLDSKFSTYSILIGANGFKRVVSHFEKPNKFGTKTASKRNKMEKAPGVWPFSDDHRISGAAVSYHASVSGTADSLSLIKPSELREREAVESVDGTGQSSKAVME